MAVSALLAIAVLCAVVLLVHNRRLLRAQADLDSARREIEDAQKKSEEAMALHLAEADELIAERKAKLSEEEIKCELRSREVQERLEKISKVESDLEKKSQELANSRELYEQKIVAAAGISSEQARKDVLKIAEEKAREEARKIRRDILEKSADEYAADAKKLLITTMQRIAPRVNEERSATLVPIPTEATKGRLIGREGRNIKSFEQCTGTTLIIDDTPGTVLVSCFDPFRRQVAVSALKRLVEDGRIHPQSIEKCVKEAEEEVRVDALHLGTKACDDLGLSNVSERVRELLGKLEYRLSINQNTLTHSIETAQLAGTFAAELGLNVEIAMRAGLFHDIGKAISAENEDAHAIAGARVLRQTGECKEVVNAVEGHHREVGHTTVYGPLLMLADSISASRPGARASAFDGYVERISGLEKIAKRFPEVVDAFAIQAGHELRVIVSSEETNDAEARAIAQKIRIAIEDELTYPGKIRVVVIRELRILEEAH